MMNLNRRKFIKRAIIAVASIELIVLFKGSISKILSSSKTANYFNAGKIENFENNKTYTFLSGKFFLKRFDDGGFLALSVTCTHLGCIINKESDTKGFHCPCHSSKFNEFGEVISAPATRPLDILPITISKGELLIDTNRVIKRESFNKSQLTYA